MGPKVYVVIPVFNRKEFTNDCLISLRDQILANYEVIVVDHGSTDGTSQMLKTFFPEVTVLNGTADLWWSGAVNLGVSYAIQESESDHDFILTLNNDLKVRNNYLASLLDLAKRKPNTLIGSCSVDINNPDKIYYCGTRWNSKTAKYQKVLEPNVSYFGLVSQSDFVDTDLLPGRGVLIPISVFKQIGLFDTEYFPHYMADEDFSLRARSVGFKLVVSTKAQVLNYVEETGLKKDRLTINYFKQLFSSTKSPVALHTRWKWAKRHASIYPPVYFAFDLLRIVKGIATAK